MFRTPSPSSPNPSLPPPLPPLQVSGWTFIMFRVIDNSSPFAGIYFYMLVLVASYSLVRRAVGGRSWG